MFNNPFPYSRRPSYIPAQLKESPVEVEFEPEEETLSEEEDD